MKLFAPKYYEKFKCIADKCKHSCCIGWQIDIDEVALNKYNSLASPYGKNIINSIENGDTPHFRLSKNDKCPHLDENGLCQIIKNVGEDYLCDICREHPRFYNYTNIGKELGIGMSCEAACSLIVSSDDFDIILPIADIEGEISKSEYNAIEDRILVFKILKDKELRISGKVEMIYDYFDIYLHDYDFSDILLELEYLYESHKALFLSATKLEWNDDLSDELSRLLAYFVYRHCSEAVDFEEFFISLSFVVFCAGLISTLANENNICEIARIVSEEIEYSEENIEKIKSLFYIDEDDYLSI